MEEKIRERVQSVIDFGYELLATEHLYRSDFGTARVIQDPNRFYEWEALAHSFLISIFGEDSSQYKLFVKNSENRGSWGDSIPRQIEMGLAVLNAAKTEIERGYLKTIEALVSADIFSDFLDMASYLLSEGYKDPAAVMIGSILEEHLRKLCKKNSIDIEYTNGKGDLVPKKADVMNADLVKTNIYNKLDQKSVTTWLDLRNKAAHGQYGEYTKEQVELMLQGITNFISRIPL